MVAWYLSVRFRMTKHSQLPKTQGVDITTSITNINIWLLKWIKLPKIALVNQDKQKGQEVIKIIINYTTQIK